MIYVLIGIIVAITTVLLSSKGMIDSVAITYGLFLTIALSLGFGILGKINGFSDPEYQSVNHTYNINKIQENQYYVLSSEGDYVSVLIDKGSGFENETFPEDVVTFIETTDCAKVDMNLKVFQKPSKADEIWFDKPSEPNEEFPEKIYESVTIYIPESSEAILNKEVFCSVCGAEIEDVANFCSRCGEKLK